MSETMEIARPWKPVKLDLWVSAIVGLGFPVAAGALLSATGALLPMLAYYGLAWGIVLWRRGSSGYRTAIPKRITPYFYANLATIGLCLACAYLARVTFPGFDLLGVVLTALVWAPLNASSEQLLWIYLYESWDLYPARRRAGYTVAAIALFACFVGAIHALYWAKFLHTVDPSGPFGIAFVACTSISGFLHVAVWKKSGQMLFTFIPHLLLNLLPLLWTGYSIVPYLLK
jgi:hypothetical protein